MKEQKIITINKEILDKIIELNKDLLDEQSIGILDLSLTYYNEFSLNNLALDFSDSDVLIRTQKGVTVINIWNILKE